MYTKQEMSQIRQKFWTSFGLYMKPVPGAEGEAINWLNYKTGKKDVFVRMDADQEHAVISLELRHVDTAQQQALFEQLVSFKSILENFSPVTWEWVLHERTEGGKIVSRISSRLEHVSVFNTGDWPAIISFLKPRLLALDSFWSMIKDNV